MTAAWLSLLPYMDGDELRELLGEGGAYASHQRGVRDLRDRVSRPVVAEVLAEILGDDPMDLVR